MLYTLKGNATKAFRRFTPYIDLGVTISIVAQTSTIGSSVKGISKRDDARNEFSTSPKMTRGIKILL